MKRTLTLVLVLALVFLLVFPAAAFAKRGGVPANGKDKAAATQSDDTAKDKGKDKKKDAEESDEDPEGVELEDEAVEGDEGEEDAEAPEEKLTGRANALSRLQRNLARMQLKVDAGLRAALPEGLQATIAKFMSFLGIDPADEAENTDEGTDEADETEDPEEPADEADDVDAGEETPLESPADE